MSAAVPLADVAGGDSGEAVPPPPLTLRTRAWAALKWLGDAAYTHWFILGLAFFIGLAAAVPQARVPTQQRSPPEPQPAHRLAAARTRPRLYSRQARAAT
jgi:hypothetical protein